MSQNEPVMSQRARFERWFSDQGKWPQAVERSGEGYKLMQADDAWRTWQAACPEGWQAVPVELIDWVERAQTLMRALPDSSGWPDMANKAKSLLADAPKPEDACKSPG